MFSGYAVLRRMNEEGAKEGRGAWSIWSSDWVLLVSASKACGSIMVGGSVLLFFLAGLLARGGFNEGFLSAFWNPRRISVFRPFLPFRACIRFDGQFRIPVLFSSCCC